MKKKVSHGEQRVRPAGLDMAWPRGPCTHAGSSSFPASHPPCQPLHPCLHLPEGPSFFFRASCGCESSESPPLFPKAFSSAQMLSCVTAIMLAHFSYVSLNAHLTH